MSDDDLVELKHGYTYLIAGRVVTLIGFTTHPDSGEYRTIERTDGESAGFECVKRYGDIDAKFAVIREKVK